jgi:hypothetical protein
LNVGLERLLAGEMEVAGEGVDVDDGAADHDGGGQALDARPTPLQDRGANDRVAQIRAALADVLQGMASSGSLMRGS